MSNDRKIKNNFQNQEQANSESPNKKGILNHNLANSNDNNLLRNLNVNQSPLSQGTEKRTIQSYGKLKFNFKSASKISNLGDEFYTTSHANCERCQQMKDSTIKSLNNLKKYFDVVNERINMFYHKVNPSINKTINVNSNIHEIDLLLSPDYYHTIYYSELEKAKLNTEVANLMRNIMVKIIYLNNYFIQ